MPALSINDVTVTEGGTATFTVSLSAASTQTVTVVASTANGTAVAPGDYTARTGVTLTFAAGTTTQTFAVTTVNDTVVEPTETFNVNLTAATNATITDAQGVGTITDNDAAATRPNVSINSTSQNRASFPTTTVAQRPRSHQRSHYTVLSVNDLGMHCGDYDTRVASILPPFNVVHAIALRKGTTGASAPLRLGEDQVSIRYSAVANPTDPVLSNPASILDSSFNGTYKTNFWDVARGGLRSVLSGGHLAAVLPGRGNILTWDYRCRTWNGCIWAMATGSRPAEHAGRFGTL